LLPNVTGEFAMETVLIITGVFALLLFVFVVCCWLPARHQAMFPPRPPITDDEFMARLPAGTNRDIALKVRRIVAAQFNVEYGLITPETSFVNDLGAD
jgi:hypothetical protein